MNRLRRWSALAGLFLLTGLLSLLQRTAPPPAEKKTNDKPAEKWLFDRTLAVSPAAAPVPALKYRLYPAETERKAGNAVPMYLRFAHERSDARKKELREKPEEWNKLPLEKLPLAEVKAIPRRASAQVQPPAAGAGGAAEDRRVELHPGRRRPRRATAARRPGDAHAELRCLVLKARVEVAEGRYADAVHTLETGFSFSQQVSHGAFLIQQPGRASPSPAQFADERAGDWWNARERRTFTGR